MRGKEKITAPFFHWFFLAEKGYAREFSFTGKRATILENKPIVPKHFVRANRPRKTHLLFSGTLGASTGIFQAIDLAKNLHRIDSEITLQIIGYAAQEQIYLRIKDEISGHDFIQLTGGNCLVPHVEIMDAIANAGFGIIIYPTSPHTQNSMPTKLYEYVASGLPILLQDHKPWVEFCHPFGGAIILEDDLNYTELLSTMKTKLFYTKEAGPVFWDSEAGKFLDVIKNM